MKPSGLKQTKYFQHKDDDFIYRHVEGATFDRLYRELRTQARYVIHLDTVTVPDLKKFCLGLRPILHSWWVEDATTPEGFEATLEWLKGLLVKLTEPPKPGTTSVYLHYFSKRKKPLIAAIEAKIAELEAERYPEPSDV